MTSPKKGVLELSWVGKAQALISSEEGRYGYEWVERSDPRASEVRQLRNVRVIGSKTGANGASENLLVTGDSIELLRSMTQVPELRDKYLGKVKLCYIDPPFNTGGVFGDHYDDALEHSIWLTLMRDRLVLIRRLLSKDGSIWVHVDDNESHRMRMLLDEVFGAESFAGEVVWQKTYAAKMDAKHVPTSHDTIFVYKQRGGDWMPNQLPGVAKVRFGSTDEAGRRYATFPLRKWGSNSLRSEGPSGWFGIESPDGSLVWPVRPDGRDGTWRWSREKIAAESARLVWKKARDGSLQPYVKQYAPAQGAELMPVDSWWDRTKAGTNKDAKAHAKKLFPGEEVFATPKPEQLLARIIQVATNEGDLVLDCFAGSGTTAATAHKLGRSWVTCELSAATVSRYTLPRLKMVVDGIDTGGVSRRVETLAADGIELPDDVSPEDAELFSKLLRKVANHVGLPKNGAVAGLIDATRTKKVTTEHWTGGGGFTVAEIAAPMYAVIDGTTVLNSEASGELFARHVAGQLGYRWQPTGPFAGQKGRRKLAIVDGSLSEQDVVAILDLLGSNESVRLIAKAFDVGALEAMKLAPRGSTLEQVPDYLVKRGRL